MPLFSPEKLQSDRKIQAPGSGANQAPARAPLLPSWEKPGPEIAATRISAFRGALGEDISQ